MKTDLELLREKLLLIIQVALVEDNSIAYTSES